jgi:hypothetical protein
LASAFPPRLSLNLSKFFGSFFQKRTAKPFDYSASAFPDEASLVWAVAGSAWVEFREGGGLQSSPPYGGSAS